MATITASEWVTGEIAVRRDRTCADLLDVFVRSSDPDAEGDIIGTAYLRERGADGWAWCRRGDWSRGRRPIPELLPAATRAVDAAVAAILGAVRS